MEVFVLRAPLTASGNARQQLRVEFDQFQDQSQREARQQPLHRRSSDIFRPAKVVVNFNVPPQLRK